MKTRQSSNAIPVQQARTASDLTDFALWLENHRGDLRAIAERGPGSPCYATVLQEMRALVYEVGMFMLHLPK